MIKLVFAFALLCSSTLVAQFSFNVNGTGIQSPTNIASGDFSTAMGRLTNANGYASTAMGNGTTANGNESMAIGRSVIASDYASLSIGHFNLSNASPTNSGSESAPFNLNNTAFVIGNGTDNNRSDAFKVLFNGATTIAGNVTAPAFIGDGSQLTNLPIPLINYSDLTNPILSLNTNNTGIQSNTNTASGSNAFLTSSFAVPIERPTSI